ncbi:hypothetical protein H9Q13_01415 [Pontibacter sp. JH31]|uniref:Lipoprotein n=1 Tax=Pontibacter aquaedesilientis TaxID=2766980 RepID=A0ABR7XBZ4_9BACT|nr:hypothetical protein [Pontibacter aquaedesilientis]MBD1395809.1 hypothetical protein [Pontibacter aquaedesilientis]
MKHFLPYSLLLATLLLFGCKAEVCKDLSIVESTATLTWSGDYAADGCGYRIEIDEQIYKPGNEQDIAESFKSSEPIPVDVKFILQGRKDIQCGMLPASQSVQFIQIISIKKI